MLSSYPTRPPLSPALAGRLVRDNSSAVARLLTLNPRDFLRTWPGKRA